MSSAGMSRARQFSNLQQERPKWSLAIWVGLLLGIGGLVFLVAWLTGWIRFTTDPHVQEILNLQNAAQEKFMANGGPRTVAEATEAIATIGVIRQKVESLPEPLREQVARNSGSMFRSMMRAQINAYFDAPPEKRKEELDRQIKQEEMMRKAFQAASTVSGFFGGGSPGPGGGASQSTDGGSQGGQQNAQQAQQSANPDQRRDVWMKRILDSTSPEERARYVEHRRAKEVRRVELGLPASPWSR